MKDSTRFWLGLAAVIGIGLLIGVLKVELGSGGLCHVMVGRWGGC